MVKRKCGTCRHFTDGGIAGSGWCQHPHRKDIQHMVLVRKSELACRNGFDQDLWELADQPIEVHTSTHIPLPMTGSDHAQTSTVRAEATESDARAGEMFTDRITSISMPTRSQLRPIRSDIDEAINDDAEMDLLGARSSVREARKRRQEQRNIERKQHQETILQQADDLLDTGSPANPADSSIVRTRAVDGPMTSSTSREPRQSGESRVDTPRDRQPASAPRQPNPRPTAVPTRTEAIEFGSASPRFRGEPQSTPPPPRNRESTAEPARQPDSKPREESFKRLETEQLPDPVDVQSAVRQQRGTPGREVRRPEQRNGVERQAAPTPTERPKRNLPVLDLPPAVEQRPTNWVTGAGVVPAEPATNLPTPYPVDPIDGSNELQTMRRCCATCRDFKQVGDGRTGWCTNPYAFSEKRMVQSNELACSSSIGVWWLPHDDRWLELADTSHHGRPTPLLDEVMGIAPGERRD